MRAEASSGLDHLVTFLSREIDKKAKYLTGATLENTETRFDILNI
jgi:hypothetical protein